MLDLVYFHCGPKAVFLQENPDFVERNEDGSYKLGNWAFPRLNYANQDLREYLWKNMELYVRDFGVDGYRLDVGGLVPNDFWVEGAKRVRKINPNALMFNEGMVKELTIGVGEFPVFDLNYNTDWHYSLIAVLNGEKPASHLYNSYYRVLNNLYSGEFGRCARYFDNHDTSHDWKGVRGETRWGEDGTECALVITHTIDGVPMIFNGCEVASECSAEMFASRFTPGVNGIDWQNLALPKGKRRMEFMKKINAIRHDNKPLWAGDTHFITDETDENLHAYVRSFENEKMLIVVNVGKEREEKTFNLKIKSATCVLSKNADFAINTEGLKVDILPLGYVILKVEG
jgi:glycosidase